MGRSFCLFPWLYLGLIMKISHVIGQNKPLIEKLEGRKVICTFNSIYYFSRDQFSPEKINPRMCTHINYQFAHLDPHTLLLIPGHQMLDIEQNFYKGVTDLKQDAPGLKVLLSLGGWADSTKKYSLLVANGHNRRKFINEVVPFLIKHNFDGLDVAWEYPNGWQGAVGVSHADKIHFPVFLKELKDAFASKNLELSISVSAIKREIKAAYDVPAIVRVVDHLNVMTFDMHGAWEGVTGHHAQFFPTPNESKSMDVITALKIWESLGADKSKLNIGIPAYGRTFTLEDPLDNGYGTKAKSVGKPGKNTKLAGYLAFSEICNLIENEAWTVKDDSHIGPYAFKDDQWVCYDSPQQIIRKVRHLTDEGYGGFLIKDISSDDHLGECYGEKYPLLEMVIKEILRREKVIDSSTVAKANAHAYTYASGSA